MTDERRGAVIFGAILIVVGGALLITNVTGFSFDAAWPLFVIVAGLVLLGASFRVRGEPGLGLAIAGSIVTTVGLILAVQEATDLYATWAYAWALVAPGSVGVGMSLYGTITGQPDLRSNGLRTAGVGLALFIGFALFFEGVIGLSGDGRPPLEGLLPIGLVVLGAILVVGSVLGRRRPDAS
jgi:hypothetical protein